MHPIRQKLRKTRFLQFISSIKITVACLALLFTLTLWGTIAQVNQGLYYAQERFFNSLFFIVGGFIPFPGARLVLWVFFLNLLGVTVTRFIYQRRQAGILVIHLGLLLYFIAAFVTFHVVEESQVTLREGQAADVSQGYHEWELSVWKDSGRTRTVSAYDTAGLKAGETLMFPEHNLAVTVNDYYPNSEAFTASRGVEKEFLNASGIHVLKSAPLQKEPEKNFPGLTAGVRSGSGRTTDVLLYGQESRPTAVPTEEGDVFLQLRRRRAPLPFLLTLKDFRMETHPGTEMARSYESLVEIGKDDLSREVLISMNEPLRYKDYTFYQASYSIDASNRYYSTLAVVKNKGRILPYAASLLTFGGLMLHFLMQGFRYRSGPKPYRQSEEKLGENI